LGKRPITNVALTILFPASLCGVYPISYDSLLPGSLVQGLGDDAAKTLGPAVVPDGMQFFVKTRINLQLSFFMNGMRRCRSTPFFLAIGSSMGGIINGCQ